MVSAIRTVGHEDRLSLVDHLDELRSRLIVSACVLAAAFAVCFWQNHALLDIINKPLTTQTQKQVAKGQGTVGQASLAQQGVLNIAADTQRALLVLAAPGSGLSAQARALLLSLPFILYELYGFILPALAPHERRAAVPLLTAVPFLFAGGVLFGYFIVLPAAVRFFVNFNSSEFNTLVQASQFYKFAATVLLAMGIFFQVPVLILGATRLGLVTPKQLRKNRRYALVACAAVAAFLPGDAITLLLETVPLYLLYEASILLAVLVKPAGAGLQDEGSTSAEGSRGSEGSPAAHPDEPAEPSVQEMIDHVDPSL